MSVNVNFNRQMGTLYVVQELKGQPKCKFKVGLYEANCLGAACIKRADCVTKEEYWDLWTYWFDVAHLKKCLGLQKSYDGTMINMYKEDWQEVVKIKLNTFFKDSMVIAKYFAQAGIKVELYYKEVK